MALCQKDLKCATGYSIMYSPAILVNLGFLSEFALYDSTVRVTLRSLCGVRDARP